MKLKLLIPVVFVALLAVLNGCQKEYYKDTGTHTANFDGNMMEYLQSKPQYFDSVVKLIQITGLESAFTNEEITFFAPADSSIRRTISFINDAGSLLGLPRVTRMEQIDKEVWRKYLSRYIFKGKKSMSDYRQIAPQNLSAFSGQIYASYDGALMNVGVIYDDAGDVKYAGYRHLMLSFIPSASNPLDYTTWYSANVASVNIAPTNGYVHALEYPLHYFGFAPDLFLEDVLAKGIKP